MAELVQGELRAKRLNHIPMRVEDSLTPDFGFLKIEAMKLGLGMKARKIINLNAVG